MVLNELAYPRHIAIEECRELGRPFIDHFHKCVSNIQSNNWGRLSHHASEMQSWWDTIRKIKLTYNNKFLSIDQLINWFFTIGSDIETVIDPEWQDVYGKLISILITHPDYKIKDIFKSDLCDLIIT